MQKLLLAIALVVVAACSGNDAASPKIVNGHKIEPGANLSGANLGLADLGYANLKGANLSGANLSGANLSGANLKNANLSGANLKGANLGSDRVGGGANLTGAYLDGANLSGANLKNAFLMGLDLSGADLSGAYLKGAYLKGAKLPDANLPDGTSAAPATTTTSAAPATTTTIKESPNWEYGNTGKPFLDSLNAFVAPFVQPVCDTLRQWGAPAETTKKEFNDFSKQVASLKRAIGSPSEPTFRDTYWLIYSFAEAALDYERKHPNDKYGAWTTIMDAPGECDRLNFTSANSKFGIK